MSILAQIYFQFTFYRIYLKLEDQEKGSAIIKDQTKELREVKGWVWEFF